MLKGHFQSAGASIEHGDASVLFPVEELGAAVLQRRDAELALADADAENVIIIAPTSLASSYFLTQHPLTAIPIDELAPGIRSTLADALDTPIEAFDLIQIGKWVTDSLDHSLAEYTDA
ncbi:hypothetical protein G3A49_16130 [Haloferax volcanii]|jgi:hypothetical protein|uniref:DUF8165 domain-containing protein n=1 Tax=Haloferax volcanii TaxID=2246 RepID=A0A558GDJ2_HALVO|nr:MULTISPECIES: hypothetical protein [Haloferax]QIB79548.1 hypothetical protein G3A49_16130 [Haloferax alexandrinus]TVT95825.1 hypothetical protein FQA18_04325 [Haloferax volcanii]